MHKWSIILYACDYVQCHAVTTEFLTLETRTKNTAAKKSSYAFRACLPGVLLSLAKPRTHFNDTRLGDASSDLKTRLKDVYASDKSFEQRLVSEQSVYEYEKQLRFGLFIRAVTHTSVGTMHPFSCIS